MAKNVADLMWEMLESAGVNRCYGIVEDALNPVLELAIIEAAVFLLVTQAWVINRLAGISYPLWNAAPVTETANQAPRR